AWQRSDSTLRFIVEADDRWIVRILHLWHRNLERQRIMRIETGIHVLKTRETFDEKPGAAKQHQRQRDFGDNQSITQTIATSAHGRTPVALLESLSQFRPRAGQTGSEPEDDSGADANCQCHS